MNDLEARLMRCFEAVLPALSPDEIRMARQDDTEQWDSLASVMLARTIEEEFGIQVDLFSLDQLTSFQGAKKLVSQEIDSNTDQS